MINETELLVPGETLIGRYQGTIAHHTLWDWSSTLPPLYITVTNFRLILQTQTRKPHSPASIPSLYLLRVGAMTLNHRPAVEINLRTGHLLCLFVSHNRDMTRALRMMLAQPVGDFRSELTAYSLEKLIDFINGL